MFGGDPLWDGIAFGFVFLIVGVFVVAFNRQRQEDKRLRDQLRANAARRAYEEGQS